MPIMQVNVVTAVHAPYAPFLSAVWASLRSQTHERWNWLVQIDGPPEAVTAALAECGALRDPRVHVAAHGTVEGPAVARNLALGRATAPFVQNVDADDELERDALAQLTQALTLHHDAGFAVGRARDLLPTGEMLDHTLPLTAGILPRGILLDRWRSTPDEYRLPVHPAGVMWRRTLLLAMGGWSALHGMEDTGLLMAASAIAHGVLLDTPTLRYRKHPAQRSAQFSKFTGGGTQIELIRQRAKILMSYPVWSDSTGEPGK